MPMLHKLKFREEHRKAFQQVFRKCLVVRTLEVGAKFAKSHELDCITLEGDQVNRKGALTGGYMDVRRSRLQSQADIVAHTEMAAKTAAQVTGRHHRHHHLLLLLLHHHHLTSSLPSPCSSTSSRSRATRSTRR